ncbi:hypothetical protein NKI66_26480 [Mesorhizobium sp. M0518]|uniref:hypothetical protein n=1 Tax=Mesorhizobium sp. M0518 TaxID=2956956 RepID=UPI003338141C
MHGWLDRDIMLISFVHDHLLAFRLRRYTPEPTTLALHDCKIIMICFICKYDFVYEPIGRVSFHHLLHIARRTPVLSVPCRRFSHRHHPSPFDSDRFSTKAVFGVLPFRVAPREQLLPWKVSPWLHRR